ncbi:anti-sigma factor [Henriciella sp. AS95]|uniref:anti-sigma factor n=1 Tax=Henriciella sp. AS95 TaxID=3135782 RepID=UPI0031712DAA
MSDESTRREELASAWLLGHATDAQVREFEQLYRTDESFRDLVSDMEGFLAPLSEDAPEIEPPAGLLDDIMAEIGGDDAPAAIAAPTPNAARRPARPQPSHPQRPWQYATAASLLIAVIAAGLHAVPGAQTETMDGTREELLALMATEQAPSVVVLLYDGTSNHVTGRLANTGLPEDGVWELWLLRDGLDGPQSLGLLQELSEDGVIDLQISTDLLAGSDTLAISLEPEGGSPDAGPTGPIVYTGKVGPI